MDSLKIREKTRVRFIGLGLSVNEYLPLLDNITLRDQLDIGRRIVVLSTLKSLSVYPEDFEGVVEWLVDSNLMQHLSGYEKQVLDSGKLTTKDDISFSWYQESLYTLLWMGKRVDQMLFPSKECNVENYLENIPPDIEIDDFLQQISFRPIEELIEELDFYYQLHWLVKHNPNENINSSVILERRKALEWVLNSELDWDNVSLDT